MNPVQSYIVESGLPGAKLREHPGCVNYLWEEFHPPSFAAATESICCSVGE